MIHVDGRSRDAALRGLYAITPEALCADPPRLERAVRQALTGGARWIQYRDKSGTPDLRRDCARRLLRACEDAGAGFIVNDDVDLSTEVGAHGVHLGADDLPLEVARARLGPAAIIGVTCQDSLARAQAAEAGGADYVAFGAFFPSRSKSAARSASTTLLIQARAVLRVPICAIGGITAGRAGALIDAGADLIAAIDGVFGADDIEAAARAYTSQFR